MIEKAASFETGGQRNAQKGLYQIRDHYINFWFHFVYPHLSDLYVCTPDEFYMKPKGVQAFLLASMRITLESRAKGGEGGG